MVRTADEILFRIDIIKKRDWLEIQTEELVSQLPIGYQHDLIDYFYLPSEQAARVPRTEAEFRPPGK